VTIDEARAHIGDAVVYHPHGADPENGVIRHVSPNFVFVAYSGDLNGAKATSPEDITLIAGGAPDDKAAAAAGEEGSR
jgi:hypothetical protein